MNMGRGVLLAWLRLLALLLATSGLSCGDDESGDSGPRLPFDDGASRGLSRSLRVTGERDVILVLESGAQVSVPAGAVTKPVTLGIERPRDSRAVPLVMRLPANRRLASAPYVLTPHGTTFTKDVEVRLPIANAAAGKRVEAAVLENEEDPTWEILGPARTAGTSAIVPLKHFSVLVLIEEQFGDVDAGPEPESDASFGAEAGTDASVPAQDASADGAAARDAAAPQGEAGAAAPDAGRDSGGTGSELDAATTSDAAVEAGAVANDAATLIDAALEAGSCATVCAVNECGPVPDGCGGTLSCGSCTGGLVCGAVTPNRCGAVADASTPAVGLIIRPSGELTTSEGGGPTTFTIALDTQPTAEVVVALSITGATDEATVQPAMMRFVTTNWSSAQTVTLTGVDDRLVDGAQMYSVAFNVASNDPRYAQLPVAPIVVYNLDNE